MSAIPTAHRRRFTAGIALGWVVAMLPVAVAFRTGPYYSGLALVTALWHVSLTFLATGWVLGIAMLVLTRIWEKRLRKAFLPPIGQVPWGFRICIPMAMLATAIVLQSHRAQRHVPGAIGGRASGTLSCRVTGDDPSAPERTCGFEQSWQSTWPEWPGELRSTEKLTSFRLHPAGHPETPGWRLEPDEGKMVHEANGVMMALDGAGLLAALEDLSGQKVVAPDSREAGEFALQGTAEKLQARNFLCSSLQSMRGCPAGSEVDVDACVETDEQTPARWWPWAVCGTAWLVIVAGLHVATRLTFGSALSARVSAK